MMPFRSIRLTFTAALIVAICAPVFAQQGATGAPPLAAQSSNQAPPPITAPQVNPVIHRISGLQMLTLLRRSGVKVAPLSDEMLTSNAIQTSIAAGLSLDDGNIVARLPRAELEISEMSQNAPPARAPTSNPLPVSPNFFVILRDGREFALTFRGLDGGTGLSLLQAVGLSGVTTTRDAKEESLILGQRVRLLSPTRALQAAGLTLNELYFVNIGELVGNVTWISRAPSGNVTRLAVTAEKLSSESLGGIAVNDAGETIGIIEASNGNVAEVIPVAGVRRAVERIRQGLQSQPRPWLGARGSSIAAVSREQLEIAGWKPAKAANLMARQIGVVLTSVAPQTPAWFANLRAGDVVVRVNGGEVRSAEEFSSLLTAAGGKAPVRFTVIRPNRTMPHVVSVTLDVSLNPVLEMEAAEESAARLASSDPLVARGMETLPITEELAIRLKVRGGRFVVFVHPASAASRAGMLAGDIIESINGKLLAGNNLPVSLPNNIALDVVRNGQKLALQIETEMSAPTRSQR